ncbi:hypothetical protein IW261DRAFT_1592121 [Armillaria novae-zelandiae]|uniref:Uncharacterized protein n=1 Tax=Armillaria novae-zelandiae TaxID=153914 RepID=A0AA39PDJ6_9AGAR|nr:hypothetical protein IW261DRAFT_1592121 [Armillaria novae-zelandiae]
MSHNSNTLSGLPYYSDSPSSTRSHIDGLPGGISTASAWDSVSGTGYVGRRKEWEHVPNSSLNGMQEWDSISGTGAVDDTPAPVSRRRSNGEHHGLRLDLNLKVDISIQAKVHGDITLSLLSKSSSSKSSFIWFRPCTGCGLCVHHLSNISVTGFVPTNDLCMRVYVKCDIVQKSCLRVVTKWVQMREDTPPGPREDEHSWSRSSKLPLVPTLLLLHRDAGVVMRSDPERLC